MHEVKDKLLKPDSVLTENLSLELFKQACEFSTDGFCIINEQHIIVDANNAFCKLFDISIDSIKNTKLGTASSNLKNFNLEAQKILDFETLTLKSSHSAFINSGKRILLNHSLLKSPEIENKHFYFWTIKDKTDFVLMKESLESQIEELRITIKSVGDGLITTDLSGQILYINPEAERLTGWKKEFAKGRAFDELFKIINEATGKEINYSIDEIIKSKGSSRFSNNTLLISRTGIKTPIAYTGNAIRNDSGSVKGAAVVFRDETGSHQKKKDLQESENKFSSVFHSGLAGITLSSPETGLYIEVNNKFLEMTKFNRSEVVGHTSYEIGLWPNEEDRNQFIGLLKKDGKVQNLEQKFVIKTGEMRTGQISAELIRIGGASFVLSIVNDITNNIKTEIALKESQTQLINALEMANLGPWEYDVDKDVFTFNDHFYKLFRTSVEQEGGYAKSSIDYAKRFVHPDDIAFVGNEIKKSIETSDPNFYGELEHRIFYADGKPGIIAIRYFIIKDHEGRTIKTYGVNQDITKQKLIEQALETEKEELNITLSNISDGVISTNADDNIILINNAVIEITGWDKEELIGKSIVEFFELLHTDYTSLAGKSRVSTIFGMNENNDSITSEAMEIESKDGNKKIIFCNSAQVKNSDGLLRGYVYVLKDITEQAKIEGQLQLSQKMEAVGQLAAGIAHEINTPMQYIMDNTLFLKESFAGLKDYITLADKYFNENKIPDEMINKRSAIDLDFLLDEIPSAIAQTESGIERVSKIVMAMKDFSHPGQKEKVMADINNGIEVTSIISKNEWKYYADLELELDKNIPPVFCNIDEINQVILNMIVNAAHAINDKMKDSPIKEKGKINISTKLVDEKIVIAISDTGAGIPADIKERIFDPFFTTKEIGKGTGQGLAIAHNIIINNHRGSISVDSTFGIGTTFKIYIPINED